MDKNDIWRSAIEEVYMIANYLATGGMRRPATSFPFHKHSFWEIVLYIRGEGTLTVDGRAIRFRPGTIVCTPPGARHGEVSDEGYQNVWVAIDDLQPAAEVPVVHLTVEHPIFSIVSILHVESHLRKVTSEMIMRNLFNTFMIYLNEWLTTDPHERLISQLKQELITNLQSSSFRVADALGTVPLSRDHLRRLFKERTGSPPIRYLTELRMERAKELLQIGLGVKEVAERVGLPDPYYFSRLFKKTQGVSPSKFRTSLLASPSREHVSLQAARG